MKIICIGRNYSEHAKEMNSAVPEKPMFFMKPDIALLQQNAPFYYPDFSNDIHYECELVVRIKKQGKSIDPKFANRYYDQIGLGIDFTARDLQQACKEKGHPWEIAKAFEGSAVISSEFISTEELDLSNISFSLYKNDKLVQQGTSADMIFSIDQIISYVSRFMTLKTGDLIYTGTPSGVGPIQIGDVLVGKIGDKEMFTTEIK
ncbi:MAG: FAA hydrolase family protein [Bacteroidetes bacterium]|nr:MAG: FAA hydrolase family protein [Bacteroidota bacterium]